MYVTIIPLNAFIIFLLVQQSQRILECWLEIFEGNVYIFSHFWIWTDDPLEILLISALRSRYYILNDERDK